jgi:hypothetical protein
MLNKISKNRRRRHQNHQKYQDHPEADQSHPHLHKIFWY